MAKIEIATIKDFVNLKLLILKALKEDSLAFTVTFDEYRLGSDSWWHSFLDPYLVQDHSKMYIAKDGGQIVGMVGVLFSRRSKQSHIATIVWFYVSKEARGRKVGDSLFSYLIKDIEAMERIKKVALNVTSTQENAQKIYAKYGFKIAGILKNELKENDTYYDVYVMEKYILIPRPNEQGEWRERVANECEPGEGV